MNTILPALLLFAFAATNVHAQAPGVPCGTHIIFHDAMAAGNVLPLIKPPPPGKS